MRSRNSPLLLIVVLIAVSAGAQEAVLPADGVLDFGTRFQGARVAKAVWDDGNIIVQGVDELNPENEPFEVKYNAFGDFISHRGRMIRAKDAPDAVKDSVAKMKMMIDVNCQVGRPDRDTTKYAFYAKYKERWYVLELDGKGSGIHVNEYDPKERIELGSDRDLDLPTLVRFSVSLAADGTITLGNKAYSADELVAHLKTIVQGRELCLVTSGDTDWRVSSRFHEKMGKEFKTYSWIQLAPKRQ